MIDFDNIFQYLPGNCIILAPDAPTFTILTFNKARAQETFTRKEQIGVGIFEAFPDNPDDPQANGVAMLRASLEHVLREKEPHQMAVQKYDIPNAGRTGFEIRYWLPKNIPVLSDTGDVAYIIHHVQDITDKVELQHKDAINRQAYDLFMQAPMGISITKGANSTIVMANKPVLALWDKDASVIGKPLLEAMPELASQGIIELINSVKASGEPYYANEHMVRLVRNGKEETLYLSFVYQPYYEDDGTITGVMTISMDVTEQVLARKKIEYAEETARLAIDSAGLGSYEISLVTNEMITSARFNEIWGKNDTIQRGEFAKSIHPDDRALRLHAHEESLRTGKLFYEARVIHEDESVHWVRINGTVIYDANRKPIRLLGVIKDITQEKAFTDELTRVVNERTKDLERAKERLERSNSELEQFAYITSHDLQEPLRKIQIFNTLIAENTVLDTGAATYSKKIASSAKRMGGLIKDLLEYSRLSQANTQFVKVDLSQVLENVLNDFELLITEKNAVIDADNLDTIEAVPLQMNQLFSNLIGNALKFSKANIAPVIAVRCKQLTKKEKTGYVLLSPDKKYCEISVSDNGIGFEQEYADRIFSVFQRLNQQSHYEGYGIGLSLCSKVVSNHEGIIFARSIVDEGSVFTVILPYTQ